MTTTAITLTANGSLANPTLSDGTTHVYRVTQGGSGGYKLTYGNLFKFPLGLDPELSTVAGMVDLLFFYDDGTNLHCTGSVRDSQDFIEAPTGFTASTNEVGQVTFNWTDNSGIETGFSIASASTAWGEVDTAAANATSKTFAVAAGTDSYWVRAYRIVNGVYYSSRPSNEATGTAL